MAQTRIDIGDGDGNTTCASYAHGTRRAGRPARAWRGAAAASACGVRDNKIRCDDHCTALLGPGYRVIRVLCSILNEFTEAGGWVCTGRGGMIMIMIVIGSFLSFFLVQSGTIDQTRPV